MNIIRSKSTSSSKRWLERQVRDPFAKQSKVLNYKSRAAFKLIEINDKFKIFNATSRNILDLGYAPGSWSQIAVQEMNKKNIQPDILGVDLIRCGPPKGVQFMQGDFLLSETQQQIQTHFTHSIDLIMSDMMTNTIGVKDADHLGSMDLCQQVLSLSNTLLSRNGNLIMKFFMGKEQHVIQNQLQQMFKKVHIFKPKSSRDESREAFFVALKKIP